MQVVVEVWHDTADDCGPNCETVRSVMTKMSAMAIALQVHDKRVTFEPHFMFSSYCGISCAQHCVNSRCVHSASGSCLTGNIIVFGSFSLACLHQK